MTAGGATFAAFPTTYALMFSYLYTALLLLLFALIIRGVSFEFRGKVDNADWRASWDKAIVVTGFLPALLFGVAFGNIFKGLPMDAAGYHGSFFSLLNPYGLLTGALFRAAVRRPRGALRLRQDDGPALRPRAEALAGKLWAPLLVVAVGIPRLLEDSTRSSWTTTSPCRPCWSIPLVAVAVASGREALHGARKPGTRPLPPPA